MNHSLKRPVAAALFCLFVFQACYVEKPIEGLTPVQLQAKSGRQGPDEIECRTESPVAVTDNRADPDEAERLNARARQHAQAGDLERARELWIRAADLDPSSASIAYNLARANESLGDEGAAYDGYCRYLALAPNADDASEVRARTVRLRPYPPSVSEDAASRFRVGIEFVQNGNLQSAKRSYDEAIDKAPQWAAAYYNRALVLEGLREYNHAKEDMERYLQLSPDAADAPRVRDKINALDLQEQGGRQLSWSRTIVLLSPVIALGLVGIVWLIDPCVIDEYQDECAGGFPGS